MGQAWHVARPTSLFTVRHWVVSRALDGPSYNCIRGIDAQVAILTYRRWYILQPLGPRGQCIRNCESPTDTAHDNPDYDVSARVFIGDFATAVSIEPGHRRVRVRSSIRLKYFSYRRIFIQIPARRLRSHIMRWYRLHECQRELTSCSNESRHTPTAAIPDTPISIRGKSIS